ncbi:MAG: caspase family protein [Candidatus Tectomicrobia bacterium]
MRQKTLAYIVVICCLLTLGGGCRGARGSLSSDPSRSTDADQGVSTPSAQRPLTSPAQPGRRALLIGISTYQYVPQLPGARNDIALVRRVLQSHYGFAPENIRVLLDDAATRTAILAALRQLVDEAQPDDMIYLHYSGHGSQVTDLSGDETDDQRDETLVPVDGRGPGVRDITDDELQMILAEFKTQRVVVVLDACHAGTATRSLAVRTRAVHPDTRVELYRKTMTRSLSIVPLISERHVLLTGAAAHEEALEGLIDGKNYGLFTYALMQTLEAGGAQHSLRQLFLEVKQELQRLQSQIRGHAIPEPQLEAPADRLEQPLFPLGGAR